MQKMADKQDKKIMLAAQFKLLADGSTHSLSVKAAMELAGFEKAEINNSTRAKENAIRRAYNAMKKKQPLSINVPLQDVEINSDVPISPLSGVQSASSFDSTLTTSSKSILKSTSNK